MHNTPHTKESRIKISIGRMRDYQAISLRAKHCRISTMLGKPKYCEICKRTDKKRYEWANKDHKYNLKKEDWMRVCNKCHMAYDRKHNNYKGFWWNTKEKIHPTSKLNIKNK